MRIALITPGFSADERDWCIPVLLNLVRELSGLHEVEVFTLRYPHRTGRYRVYDADVQAFGGATTAGAGRLPLLAKALAGLIQAHRRQPFDLLHAFWADEPGFLAVTAGSLIRRPAVVSLMGGELAQFADIGYGGRLSRANWWLTRQALRAATHVTTGSSYLSRLAAPFVAPERLTCLPLGVDTTLFSDAPDRGGPCALPPISNADMFSGRAVHEPPLHTELTATLTGDPVILQVASLVPVKDQALLLRAVARLTPHLPGAHLHFVGSGPLRDELERLAQALGISTAVTFHGDVPHEQLPGYYRAADVMVLTSRYESQCLAVLEAAACGLPVVGTAVGILPDLAPPGLTVPVGDVDALAGSLLDLLMNPVRRDALSRSGLAAIQADYSLAQTVERLELLYLSLIRR